MPWHHNFRYNIHFKHTFRHLKLKTKDFSKFQEQNPCTFQTTACMHLTLCDPWLVTRPGLRQAWQTAWTKAAYPFNCGLQTVHKLWSNFSRVDPSISHGSVTKQQLPQKGLGTSARYKYLPGRRIGNKLEQMSARPWRMNPQGTIIR